MMISSQMQESLPAGKIISHYRLLSRLGAGGMGEVYLAEDTRLGRKVALKLLPREFTKEADRVRRFEQEARAASALNHPNIITIYDIGQAEGLYFIVTEFIEGCTLRERLRRTSAPQARTPLSEVLEIAIQVASALQAAHEAGIIHRDIKPENIMLRPDGYVKVLDFGLAKLTERRGEGARRKRGEDDVTLALSSSPLLSSSPHLTRPGTVLGTLAYMSPEQTRGLKVDGRSDIFSLGIVLYEMIAGCAPFDGQTAGDLIAAILRHEPVTLARYRENIPAELEWVVTKALRKDRDERYQTVKSLCSDLRQIKGRLDFEAELVRLNQPELPFSRGVAQANLAVTQASTVELPARGSAPPRRARTRKAIDSLAILPLANASADPNMEYLSDGITESIINSLSQLPKLRVVPRSTVFRYKGREIDPQQIGRELGVRALLTGRMLQLGDALVIRAELIDVAQESQLWGEQYCRQMTDIFALQAEISQEISQKLRLRLTGEEKKKLAKRDTENTEAYHLYLKGRYYTGKRTSEWIQKGIEHFQQAIDLDPNYALAYAGLADAYAFLASSTGGWAPREAYPKAKAAALKALELDETLGEAHCSLGFFRLLYDWDFAAAEREYRRAIELSPNYANAHDGYGFYLKATGQYEAAIGECQQAVKLDPLSPFTTLSLGWAYYFARQYDQAIAQACKVLEMDPNFSFAHWHIGMASVQKHLYDEAITALNKAFILSGGSLVFEAHLGHAYALAGREAAAREMLAELQELAGQRYVPSYFFALIHLGLGELDETFAWLGRAYGERSGFLAFLKVEPMLDSLRADARFTELLRRVGLER
jgi:serine/threonine protein kinase/tetratricopeptide (TPR) repeat protein